MTEDGLLLNVSGNVTVKVVDNTPSFTDISNTTEVWYNDAVNFVGARNIMNGTDSSSFQPNAELSRGMIAQMLYNLEGQPESSTDKSFGDVDGQWYSDAVLWAAEMGVVSGYNNGDFGANDNMTREQMATILYRYSSNKGYDMTVSSDMSDFSDAGETSSWAQDAVAWAVSIGLMSGKGDGSIDPQGTASRAEVATVFMNYCQNVAQ
jgi:hypothetical protein